MSANVQGLEVHAHRGGSQIYVDNSLEAIKDGLSKGATYIEIDIHMTKDNKFVLSHDPMLTAENCNFKKKKLKTLIIKK